MIDNDYDGSDFNGVVDRNVTYEYDADSNRKKVVDYCAETQEIYTHVPGTQRLDRVTYSEGKYKHYSWTPNGEMEREDYYEGNALESSQIYTWGIGGTLIEVRFEGGDNDGCNVNYIYDNENELIGRKVTLKTGAIQEDERYLVDNLNPTGYSQRLAVLSKDGSIRHEIFTDELAAETTVNSGTANTQFAHADGLGSIRALTGKSSEGENLGTDADRHFYDYTAFGSPLRGDRSLTNYAFTGQIRDPDTSNQYHRARWLSTGVARWISNDPVFDFKGNYGSTYSYVGSNPVNQIDPLGQFGGGLLDISITSVVMGIMATDFMLNVGVGVYKGYKMAGWIGALAGGVEYGGLWITAVMAAITFSVMLASIIWAICASWVVAGAIVLILSIPLIVYSVIQQAKAAGEASGSGDDVLTTLESAILAIHIFGAAIGGTEGYNSLRITVNRNNIARTGAPVGLTYEVFEKGEITLKNNPKVKEIGGQLFVQGSRANGKAFWYKDIDIAIRLNKARFAEEIERCHPISDNPGKMKSRRLAIERGRIFAGEAKIRGARKQFANTIGFPEDKVDLSLVEEGGLFDRGLLPFPGETE